MKGGKKVGLRLPDLVPVPQNTDAGPFSFCGFDDNGNLIVTILNQGTGVAGPSTTRVEFSRFPRRYH